LHKCAFVAGSFRVVAVFVASALPDRLLIVVFAQAVPCGAEKAGKQERERDDLE